MEALKEEIVPIEVEGHTKLLSVQEINLVKAMIKTEKAVKNDSEKVRMDLLPPYALTEIAKVFTIGAKKYSDWNYLKDGGLETSRVYAALLRHLFAWYSGESLDPETGESHLTHAGCCAMMLIELDKFGTKNQKPAHYKK